MEMLSTKISGLAIDTEYTFHLVLRTTAGTFHSEKLVCRTHKMTDLSGITVTPGIMPPNLRESLAAAVNRIGGKLIDTVRIDTTHFVCTEGRGPAWEKAVEMNIPVVRPEWVEGCEREGTIVSVRGYYLNADPKLRQIGPGIGAQQNRENAILHTNQTSMQRQNVPPSIDSSAQAYQVQQPMVTPFPGGASREESDLGSPPPPPPKDNKSETGQASEPGKSRDGQYHEEDDYASESESEGGELAAAQGKQAQEPPHSPPISGAEVAKSRSRDDPTLPHLREEGPNTNGATKEQMHDIPL
jgi:hypothetical protein